MILQWIEVKDGGDRPFWSATAPSGVQWGVMFWGEIGRHGPSWCILRGVIRLQRPLDRMILFPSMAAAKIAVEWCAEHSPCRGKDCVDGFVPMPECMRGHVQPFRDVCPVCEGSALDGQVPGQMVLR